MLSYLYVNSSELPSIEADSESLEAMPDYDLPNLLSV